MSTSSNTLAADLREEIRRLRIRVTALTADQLDAHGDAGQQRRQLIRDTLAQLSEVRSGGQPVPQLSDRVLADQLVVLLEDCLPEAGASSAHVSRALTLARALRQGL